MKIVFYTAGGTIDKIYFDKKNKYEVGESLLHDILEEANITFDYESKIILQKDSLDLTDEDRKLIHQAIRNEPEQHIVLTHGTDTMAQTAETLMDIKDKVIVLTGSMTPARFRESDAVFNIAAAITAVQTLPFGVYITMNGRIFNAGAVRKNVEKGVFEITPSTPAKPL